VGIYYSTRIDNEGFRRFTVAHEIGHFELGHDTSVLSPSGAPHSSRSNFVSDDWFEEEADAFATELLLPRAMFLPRSTGKVLGISLVQRLADVFGTSLTSTAIRYAEVSPDPVIVIVSEAGRILYHFRSACVQRFCVGYLRRGDPLPAASATAHMIGRKAPSVEDSTYLSVWFEGVHYDLPFDEDALDLGRYGKTLTILHARELPDREALDAGEDDDEY
jgi:hypothetical protein